MKDKKLFDKQGRVINYLRLAVTDRCNLRCFYCMPETGIDFTPRTDLLSYEELLRLTRVLSEMGINKLRITGGEPFVRKDMMKFIASVNDLRRIEKINITTNGTITRAFIPDFKKVGIASVNLSLDTLDKDRFFEITRRDVLPEVLGTLDSLLSHDIPTKINTVVMDGKNIQDITEMVKLTKDNPISVRFIEEMPFNGADAHYTSLKWDYNAILEHIRQTYPTIEKKVAPPHSTAALYQIPGFKGDIGIIAAYSRTFCGSCNRLRVTPKGVLRTCLYDSGTFNLRDFMRNGATDEQLVSIIQEAFDNRAKDGFEAEKKRHPDLGLNESMSTIGG